MLYATLIAKISALTGVAEDDIRKVLVAFPEVVMDCGEGEQVKTPFGAFKIVRRKMKKVRSPSGSWSYAPERLQARIRPGVKLQRDLEVSAPRHPLSDLPDLEDPED